jgi:DNA modification methylase
MELIHGDCNEVMKEMADESIDAIVTDPPYGLADGEADRTIERGKRVEEFGEEWDKEFPTEWLEQAHRVLKPGCACVSFCDTKRVGILWRAMQKYGFNPLQVLFWHKTNSSMNFRKNYRSCVETAVFARKAGKIAHWNGGGVTENFVEGPRINPNIKIHPTEKPVYVLQWILRLVTDKDSVVLDPFAGSCSTAIACLNLGCKFIGIEMEKEYVSKAWKRITRENNQGRMF